MKSHDNALGSPAAESDSIILCSTSQGYSVRATPLRITRDVVVFEVYNPYSILQLSEVLTTFRIIVNDQSIYSGRATVSNLVNTGIMLVCEASREEGQEEEERQEEGQEGCAGTRRRAGPARRAGLIRHSRESGNPD